MAAGVTLLAKPFIFLVFGESFAPAVLALQLSVWQVPFALVTVPNARLMLVYGKQTIASWIRGLAMVISVILNLLLIPRFGIYGSAIASVVATIAFFVFVYLFVQITLLKDNILPMVWKPVIATALMTLVVWFFRDAFFLIPIVIGTAVYIGLILLLGVFTAEDRLYLRQLVNLKPA